MTVSGEPQSLFFGPFRLTPAERLLVKGSRPVAIGGRALDILIVLTGRAGEVVGARELIDRVWHGVHIEEANLRVHIAALRKALGDGKGEFRYIVNVPGRGYSFVAPTRRSTMQAAASGVPTHPPRLQELPPLSRLLLGRDQIIADLSQLLLSRRFVSVVGPGGIGKTTVAVAVAHALSRQFSDAACFVDLGALTDPADVPNAVASAIGCLVQGADPEASIRAFLSDKRILIVLDNCEHVIDTVAPLAERLCRAALSAHFLTTSREALRVEGEHVHLLTPLDNPPDERPSALQAIASPAVQLFMERAASSGYRAALTDADAPTVARICRQLDGVALAIELVASRVGAHGIDGTAELLESGVELTLQGRRGSSPRHQTLQSMLDWSFRLLSANEQTVFRRLAVFVGQFTLAAGQAIARDTDYEAQVVTDAIASLVDKSLIAISSSAAPAYYRLLDTTRTFAAAKLAQSGEGANIAGGHARYFAGLLGASTDGFAVDRMAGYVPLLGDVRKALAWCFSGSGERSIGIELAAHAASLLLEASLFAECRQWCERALAALDEAHRGTRLELELELELQLALAMSSMYGRGNSDEVRHAIERGLDLAHRVGDAHRQLRLLSGLYIFLTRQGDFAGALGAARRSAAITEAGSDPARRAMAAWMFGGAYHLTGNHAVALRHCKEGVELALEFRLGRVSFFGHDHHVSGVATYARCLWLCGFVDQGLKVAREGIAQAASYEDPVSQCIALIYLIPVLQWSGDLAGAAAHTEIVVQQAAKYSLAPYRAVSLALKGESMVASGNPVPGAEMLQEAVKAMDANRYRIVTLPTSRALAEGLVAAARPAEALATITEATTYAEPVGDIMWLPDLLRARGEILLAQPAPDIPAAEACLLRAIDCARKQSALSWELRAALPLAQLWLEQGRGDEASAMLLGIYQRFPEGFDTRDLVAARHLLGRLNSPA
jgi:predicted ATPase/DNA-binding winged helix-turn-helix (wHTH) protein